MTFEPVERYIEAAAKYDVATPEELAQWRSDAQTGDSTAQYHFTRCHLAQTAEIALRLKPEGWSNDKAINEANMVLLRLIYDTDVDDVGAALEARIRRRFAG